MAWTGLCLVGAVKLSLSLGQPFTSGGDVAFIEIQVHQALHGGVALGPYSRYGWHHPGPLLFYLFAPLYWLSGESSRSLFLSSWLLNIGSAIGSVALIRRRIGEPAALVATFILMFYLSKVGFSGLINPWNPSVLALPVLLLVVSAASAASGSGWSLVIMLVTGSFLVQTHIATAPLTAIVWVVSVAGFVARGRRGAGEEVDQSAQRLTISDLRWLLSAPAVVGGLLLLLIWIGPLAQEITSSHGNITKLVDFYLNTPAKYQPLHHSLRSAVGAVTAFATILPFGRPSSYHGDYGRAIFALGIVLVGAVSAVILWRRQRFVAWMCVFSAVGVGVAVLSATRVVGPFETYLFYWCESLLLPVLIAIPSFLVIAALRHGRATLTRLGLETLVMAGAIVATAMTIDSVAHSGTASYGDSPDSRAIARKIESLAGSKSRVFTVHVLHSSFADGATILTLVRDGYLFRVTPAMDLYGGDASAPTTGLTFELQAAGASSSTRPTGRFVMGTSSLQLWEVSS